MDQVDFINHITNYSTNQIYLALNHGSTLYYAKLKSDGTLHGEVSMDTTGTSSLFHFSGISIADFVKTVRQYPPTSSIGTEIWKKIMVHFNGQTKWYDEVNGTDPNDFSGQEHLKYLYNNVRIVK